MKEARGPRCPNCGKQVSVKVIEKVWGFKITAKELKKIRQEIKGEFAESKKGKKGGKKKQKQRESSSEEERKSEESREETEEERKELKSN